MWHHVSVSEPALSSYQSSLTLQAKKLRPRGVEVLSWGERNPGGLTSQNSHDSSPHPTSNQLSMPLPGAPSLHHHRQAEHFTEVSHPLTFYKVFDCPPPHFFFKWSEGLSFSSDLPGVLSLCEMQPSSLLGPIQIKSAQPLHCQPEALRSPRNHSVATADLLSHTGDFTWQCGRVEGPHQSHPRHRGDKQGANL